MLYRQLIIQFIKTSICTNRALVSPGNLYGIIPANVINALECSLMVDTI